ncbi:hypothetical protein FOA52_010626, partial [Chlamydomonas sp. UWO 241]
MRGSDASAAMVDGIPAHLLRNKALRIYFNGYAAKDLPEVMKLTLLHGVLNLSQTYPERVLAVDQLREVLASASAAATVEASLPDLVQKLDALRDQLSEVATEVHAPQDQKLHQGGRSTAQPTPQFHTTSPHHAVPSVGNIVAADGPAARRRSRSPARDAAAGARARPGRPGPHAHQLPSDDWRCDKGPRTYLPPGRKRSPVRPGDRLAGAIYPAWWGDGSAGAPAAAAFAAAAAMARAEAEAEAAEAFAQRPQPRLAYSSVPTGPRVYDDDLVTARYLKVPSSGYRQQPGWQPPSEDAWGPPVLPSTEPQPRANVTLLAWQQQGGKDQRPRAKEQQQTPQQLQHRRASDPRVRAAQSVIAGQVRRDRAAHARGHGAAPPPNDHFVRVVNTRRVAAGADVVPDSPAASTPPAEVLADRLAASP